MPSGRGSGTRPPATNALALGGAAPRADSGCWRGGRWHASGAAAPLSDDAACSGVSPLTERGVPVLLLRADGRAASSRGGAAMSRRGSTRGVPDALRSASFRGTCMCRGAASSAGCTGPEPATAAEDPHTLHGNRPGRRGCRGPSQSTPSVDVRVMRCTGRRRSECVRTSRA